MLVGMLKVAIACATGAWVLHASHRRWLGVLLAVAALATAGAEVAPRGLVHVHEQFHYVLGARYFPELGYTHLYKCALVAEEALGFSVQTPERRIRDLDDTSLLLRVSDLDLGALRDECHRRFAAARWRAFLDDVRAFRAARDPARFAELLEDHGFNPPPPWLLAGRALASLPGAGPNVALALVDLVLLAAMFAALGWAFGLRAVVLAAVAWGCQGFAGFGWTAGGFLRQDWLCFLVLGACAARRHRFALSGASVAAAASLRVFPALVALPCLVVIVVAWHRRGHLASAHKRALAGAFVAAAVISGATTAMNGTAAWGEFAHRTLEVHDRTWTSNLMGTSVAVAYAGAPRLAPSIDPTRADPTEAWRRSHAEHAERSRLLSHVLTLVGLAFLVVRLRRAHPPLWLAICLGPVAIILATHIANYYYAFIVLAAPLARRRVAHAAALCAFVAATQLVALLLPWPDDAYAVLSVLATAGAVWLTAAVLPRRTSTYLVIRAQTRCSVPPRCAA